MISTVINIACGVYILHDATSGIGMLETDDAQVPLLDDVELVGR